MKTLQTIKPALALIFTAFILSVLVSCSSSTDTSAPATGTGRVSLLITDGPTNDFDQINVTLESISFLCEDDDDEEVNALEGDDDSKDDGCHEVVLFEETRVINLLALQNYSEWLSTTTIPAYEYSKIRLHVSLVELVKLNPDGTVLSVDVAKLPANGKIDLNPRGSFDVATDGHLVIELDMDAEKSIHIVETGNGKFIFRPVIFVSILGEEELKLVILDGKVLAKTETGFQLCEVEAVEVTDDCLSVLISDNTVVQDDKIDVVVLPEGVADEDFVTVLGRAGDSIGALHIVIAAKTKEAQNLALFTGEATSAVNVDNFDMKTDDENDVVPPETMLTVELADSARIFDEYGNVATIDKIVAGSAVDVFGLAIPDLSNVDEINAAFVIYDNDEEDDKISGEIVAVDGTKSQITVFVVNGSFSGDVCVDVDSAEILFLSIVGDKIVQEEIMISKLQLGMIASVYGDDDGSSCMTAGVVLVTEAVVSP